MMGGRGGAAPGGRGGGMNFGGFEQILISELIPYIDANYRTIADQAHRAMAGLSMGGMQTHSIAMANLDKFSHIGLFSGSTISASEITDVAGFKEKVKALFMSCGSKENTTGLQASHDELEKIGIKSTTFVQPDAQHEWRVWRASLIQFLPLLFQD